MQSFFQIKALLNQSKGTNDPTDDFRIIDSWAEYDEEISNISVTRLKR